MRNVNIPITRENYLDLAYMGDVPSPLSAEEEAEFGRAADTDLTAILIAHPGQSTIRGVRRPDLRQ
jgi:hypothetical protein